MSPHVLPPSIEKSYPHLLNPTRESFARNQIVRIGRIDGQDTSACDAMSNPGSRVLMIPPLENAFEQP
jgi:hypothetical protein